jgi:hypothetical protein
MAKRKRRARRCATGNEETRQRLGLRRPSAAFRPDWSNHQDDPGTGQSARGRAQSTRLVREAKPPSDLRKAVISRVMETGRPFLGHGWPFIRTKNWGHLL